MRMVSKNAQKLEIIGVTEYVDIAGVKNVPAKIDTGADTSSVWASDINMKKDGTLEFSLFGPKSPYYTGEKLQATDYRAKVVRSSHGDTQVRYRVKLPVVIGDKSFETTFTLANRSRNRFPILIGRHTLEGIFLVNVAKSSIQYSKGAKSVRLDAELKSNPYAFHQKYINLKEGK